MPRLNRLWEDFQVPRGATWVCGLCGDTGRVTLTQGDSYYWQHCICPRGQALKMREREPQPDPEVPQEAVDRNRAWWCGMQPSQYTEFKKWLRREQNG